MNNFGRGRGNRGGFRGNNRGGYQQRGGYQNNNGDRSNNQQGKSDQYNKFKLKPINTCTKYDIQ